jgi:LysR family hydrogen peroxide-inducible transcriptional activator
LKIISVRAHDLSLRQLQYAVAVADALHFRRAADACRVSQPALSAQLAELEGALGVRLFERDRRRVLLTAAGAELVERARGVLRGVDDLVAAAERFVDPFAGTLRIGVIPTIAPYALPGLTPALRRRFPRLRVEWREERTAEVVRALDAGGLDAGLLALEAEIGTPERAVVASDPFVLVARRDHPLGKGRGPLAPEALEGAEVLLLDDGHCFRGQALALCRRVDAGEAGFRATSLTTLVQMVLGGGGVTLIPEVAVASETRRGGLVARRFRAPAPHRTIALVWRPASPHGPALRELAATLRAAWPGAGRPRP